jgi:hypothetical protein
MRELPRRHHLEYLLEEGVGVAEPSEREECLTVDIADVWPEGWWGVWDEDDAFIAYFKNEEDAYAFRLFLITVRQQGEQIATRYKKRKK